MDAEDQQSPKGFMKEWHSSYFQRRYSPESFESKQTYYRLADAFLHKHNFQNQKQRRIWEMHADGQSMRAIAAALNIKLHVVHRTINELVIYIKVKA